MNTTVKKQNNSKKVVTKPMKKNASKKKRKSLKKNKTSAKKQKLSTALIQEKTAIVKTPTNEDVDLRPSPVPKPSPGSDGPPLKKKERHQPKRPDRTPAKLASPVSEALNDVKKKPSIKATTPKEGTLYGEDEKIEMKKTAKTQSMTTVQETKEEPVKPSKNESDAHRHRNSLKPGEVNEKSDDTIEDVPSIRKREGPSYESDGGPILSPNGKPDGIVVKKLSKEKDHKDQEAAK